MAAVSVSLVILLPAFSHAEDAAPLAQEVIITAEDYAKLLGAYGQIAPLTAERNALQQSLANMTEQRDLLTERVRLKTAIADDYRELAEIRKLRAEEAEKRGDRIAGEKRKEGFLANVREKAALGALAGSFSPFPPPPLNIAVGAALGALYGAIESLVQGP